MHKLLISIVFVLITSVSSVYSMHDSTWGYGSMIDPERHGGHGSSGGYASGGGHGGGYASGGDCAGGICTFFGLFGGGHGGGHGYTYGPDLGPAKTGPLPKMTFYDEYLWDGQTESD